MNNKKSDKIHKKIIKKTKQKEKKPTAKKRVRGK